MYFATIQDIAKQQNSYTKIYNAKFNKNLFFFTEILSVFELIHWNTSDFSMLHMKNDNQIHLDQ